MGTAVYKFYSRFQLSWHTLPIHRASAATHWRRRRLQGELLQGPWPPCVQQGSRTLARNGLFIPLAQSGDPSPRKTGLERSAERPKVRLHGDPHRRSGHVAAKKVLVAASCTQSELRACRGNTQPTRHLRSAHPLCREAQHAVVARIAGPAVSWSAVFGCWLFRDFRAEQRWLCLESSFDKNPLEYLKYQLSLPESSAGAACQPIL